MKEKMMPGQEPYTDEERAQRDALIEGACLSDPGEENEPPAEPLTEKVLEKAHTMVSTRKSQIDDMHRALGEARRFARNLRALESELRVETERADLEYDKEIAALSEEMSAAVRQFDAKVAEAAERREKALNKVRSIVGVQTKSFEDAKAAYRKAKRILAKMMSELP